MFLRIVKSHYSDANFITRDDLLEPPIFGHVGHARRYQLVRQMVDHLLVTEELVYKSRTNLCLKAKSNSYEETPLHETYYDTIASIVSTLGRKAFDVMTVIENWTTDPHLTPNNKRVAVRHVMTRLVREGTIKAQGEFRYKVA
jgi:hypothetical protein